MITKISFPAEYNQSKKMLFETADLTKMPDPRVIPLFGPNGVGKTTLLSALWETYQAQKVMEKHASRECDPDEIRFYEKECRRTILKNGCDYECHKKGETQPKMFFWSNTNDNFRHRKDRGIYDAFDPFLINARFDAQAVSEGQSIIYSIFDLFNVIMETEAGDELTVLIDEMDSGLSIDNIDVCMRKIKKVLRYKGTTQIIFSFNNPRVLKFFPDVLSLYDGQPLHMKDDNDMILEIRDHKVEFDKIRKKSNGMPKVYD